MNWILFQLIFDIILFAFIIYAVVLAARQKQSTPDDLRQLLAEFNKAVERGEAAARELDRQVQARRAMPGGDIPGQKEVSAPEGFNPAASGGKMAEDRRKVAALRKHGLAADEISRRLALPLAEVELIMAMLEGGE